MTELRAKHVEGTSVDAPHLDAPKGDTSPTQWEEIPWSLLSTARHDDGLRPVQTTTSMTLMDSHYHKRYGGDGCPKC